MLPHGLQVKMFQVCNCIKHCKFKACWDGSGDRPHYSPGLSAGSRGGFWCAGRNAAQLKRVQELVRGMMLA